MNRTCWLCGEPVGLTCDGTEASHDGDGMEPCYNGHYGCSTSGRTGGPCINEKEEV